MSRSHSSIIGCCNSGRFISCCASSTHRSATKSIITGSLKAVRLVWWLITTCCRRQRWIGWDRISSGRWIRSRIHCLWLSRVWNGWGIRRLHSPICIGRLRCMRHGRIRSGNAFTGCRWRNRVHRGFLLKGNCHNLKKRKKQEVFFKKVRNINKKPEID